ncbi:hypothetical protein Sjap_015585 [Stephania japonica]|uniref:Lon N-terminal domain-containing protein n=1 Tax=Stephania japonica TaxID=461633 RepID=A0AAP0IJK0_9MAGN
MWAASWNEDDRKSQCRAFPPNTLSADKGEHNRVSGEHFEARTGLDRDGYRFIRKSLFPIALRWLCSPPPGAYSLRLITLRWLRPAGPEGAAATIDARCARTCCALVGSPSTSSLETVDFPRAISDRERHWLKMLLKIKREISTNFLKWIPCGTGYGWGDGDSPWGGVRGRRQGFPVGRGDGDSSWDGYGKTCEARVIPAPALAPAGAKMRGIPGLPVQGPAGDEDSRPHLQPSTTPTTSTHLRFSSSFRFTSLHQHRLPIHAFHSRLINRLGFSLLSLSPSPPLPLSVRSIDRSVEMEHGGEGETSYDGFDDVEEFVWDEQAAQGMSRERFAEVVGLMQRGNRAFRTRIEEAITLYSKAHNLKPGDPVILSNRSLAFIRNSQFLKNRSASDSEYHPVNGLDPTTHAELAVKDTEKLISVRSNSAKPYYLKANALMLLERYDEVHETLLSGLQADPLCVTLKNILQKNFPEEYAERKSEHEGLTNLGVDLMPLFVMDVVLPCQKMSLNIFEPRYRLMVRRIMEGNHRMGMVGIDSATGSLADFACEVEITEWVYRIAEIEWISDIYPPEGTRERGDEMARDAAELARSWINKAKETARADRRSRHRELLQADGMPSPNDPEHFSFWLVSLLNLIPSEKLELLHLRDTRERIQRGLIYLRAGEPGCRVQ